MTYFLLGALVMLLGIIWWSFWDTEKNEYFHLRSLLISVSFLGFIIGILVTMI